MSDSSQGPGWWQASDGKWYPPQPAASVAPPPPPPAPPPGPQWGAPPAPQWGAPPAAPPKKSNRGCLIALAVVGVVVALGIVAVVLIIANVKDEVDKRVDTAGEEPRHLVDLEIAIFNQRDELCCPAEVTLALPR